MRKVKTVSGWTLYEQDACYYVRYEEVVAFMAESSTAESLLRAALEDTLDSDGEPV